MSGSVTQISLLPATRGDPDWQGMFRTDKSLLLPAWGDAELCFIVPRKVRLETKTGGAPDFFLEFVSDRNGPSPENSLYATLNMALTQVHDMAGDQQAAKLRPPLAMVVPTTFTTGTFWHFECAGQHESRPFVWEDADRARIQCRLSQKTGQLLYASLESGSLTVARAAVECEVAAFLPRIEATVTFRTADLLQSLRALSRGADAMPFDRVVEFFENAPASLLKFEGNPRGEGRGLALAGRVRHFWGAAAPCMEITNGPYVALPPLAAGIPEFTSWDLRTPLMTGTPVFLDFDPFTPVIQNGGREGVTHFTRLPPLPADLLRERVEVVSSFPPNIQGCAAIVLTLLVTKEYSVSGSAMTQTVDLYPPTGGSKTVELQFGKIGAKPYRTRVTLITDEDAIEMPWVDGSGDYLYLDAQRLNGSCVTVRGTAALLEQAAIGLRLKRTSDGDLTGTLTAGEPALTFLLASGDEVTRLAVEARDLAGQSQPLLLDLPGRSSCLDLASFWQYGPQTTPVTVQFLSGEKSAQFEFLPESGDGQVELRFTPDQASGQFSYFSPGLFRPGYRYRSTDTGPGAPWSDLQTPGLELKITA